jgi:O-antigen ligase
MRIDTTLLSQNRAVAVVALISGGFLLFSILVTTFLSPAYGLVEIGILAGGLVALYFTFSLRKFVWLLLVTKPLIDLTWRWRFATVAEQEINIQTLIAVLVIIVTALTIFLRRKQVVLNEKVILLVVFAILSVLLTPTSWAINELIRLIAGVSFFFTAGVVLSEEDFFDRFAKSFILAVSVPVVLGLLQKAGVLPFEYWDWFEGQKIGRVSGTYQHPLGLIYFLIYAIPLALYLLTKPSLSLLYRLLLWSFIGLSLMALVFTYHRMALVAIGLEIWLWMVLTKKYGRAILLVVLGGILVFWLRDWIQLLYRNIFDILQGKVAFSSGEFLRGRGMNWYLFLHSLFSSHPLFWLFGRGGSVAEGFVPHFGYWSSNEPHNDFIRILHAYGLVGLGLYLIILFSFFWKSLRLRCMRGCFSHHLGNLMIVVLTSIVLLSTTTEPMRYPTGVWYLFTLGSVVSVHYRWLRQLSPSKH